VTGKLHLKLFHGSKGRCQPDTTAPAISAAGAAQAFANFEFGAAPFGPRSNFATSPARTRIDSTGVGTMGTLAPRLRRAAQVHRQHA
jgi:hypothetical protein